jgi:16S rRNA (adenine1518-N6/adenine1519-N6)-dimethyltransferase
MSHGPVNLFSPRAVSDLLQRHGVRTNKSLGQNFLLDKNTLERIVAAAKLGGDEAVLEIGPGLGALTRMLAERAASVTAVEIDAGFVRVLAETVADMPNVHIEHADFLKLDLPSWARENLAPLPATVVANVPYYITSPLLVSLLRTGALWRTIVVLVQKEIAGRLRAGPGAAEYGSLSVFAQVHAEVEVVGAVPRGVFYPPPKVDSAIVRFTPLAQPPVPISDPRLFEQVVRAAFGQRRKTLSNALSAVPDWTRDTTLAALGAAGIDPQRRGETLGVADFAAIANAAAH